MDTKFYALHRLMNTMIFMCLLCAGGIYLLSYQKRAIGRESFLDENGIGVAAPAPDKDGTWTMPVEYKLKKPLPENHFLQWEASVHGSTITLKAFVIDSSMVQRLLKLDADSYGASFAFSEISERTYSVQFESPDKGKTYLGEVAASLSNDFGSERIWN